ncbi:MAG: hypothetical protein Q8N03_17210, partial [Ignavibacteria bacterium]|nr:hypothetical protein [Ignavibacteria bacterium]
MLNNIKVIMSSINLMLVLLGVIGVTIPILPQTNSKEVIELYKKSTITQQLVSPGYTKEILWYSTYFQGKLYVGTYPNAHLYR